uniref:Protein with SprT-like domain at the N terminus n=1 Tax=Culicoides sonorensis TaxID=179676 RepID=A0A336KV97_CULSO
MDSDFELARKLQEEELKFSQAPRPQKKNKENQYPQASVIPVADHLNHTQNLVDPEWEIIDPTPNIFVLKDQFDKKFFLGKLIAVELEWSKQMYKCAGICYQRSNGLGMKSCTIRLSEPLLKLRPRKDLVETLLHEMIHAFLFVHNIREGNGGHGPNFKKMMEGINRQAGTNITVYHTFHDECRLYEKHWWRCNGPCQNKKPYFGYVKRVHNRAPGPNDFWYEKHRLECGGTFIKIKEPTPKKKAPKGKAKSSQPNKISNYIQKTTKTGGATTMNRGGGTLVVTKPTTTKTNSTNPNKSIPIQTKPVIAKPAGPKLPANIRTINSSPSKNTNPNNKKSTNPLPNVTGFKDIDDTKGKFSPEKLFSGNGKTLGGGSGPKRSRLLDQFDSNPKKKQKTEPNDSHICLSDGEDDIIRAVDLDEIERHHDTTMSQTDKAKDRQLVIKQEILDSNGFSGDDEIILIDDDFDDELVNTEDELNFSKEVIDDLFNDDMMGNVDKKPDNENTIPCPICEERFDASIQKAHVEECYTNLCSSVDTLIAKKPNSNHNISDPGPSSSSITINIENQSTPIKSSNVPVIDLTNNGLVNDSDGKVQCPVCPKWVPSSYINEHLDKCLENSFDSD